MTKKPAQQKETRAKTETAKVAAKSTKVSGQTRPSPNPPTSAPAGSQTAQALMIPLANLLPADANVRRGEAPAIDELARSLMAIGQLQSLKVTPINDDFYQVIAGSRRLKAFTLLCQTSQIDADHPVACLIDETSAASVREQQLAENTIRRNLSPIDEYEAFAQLLERDGASIEAVANRFSITARHVKQRLRLGTLAEPIRDALRAGDITLDVAQKFAVTSDGEQQTAVFTALSERDGAETIQPFQVERMMMERAYSETHRLVTFVGADTYRDKGGRIEENLFSDHALFSDGPLLERLAAAKLQEVADTTAQQEGWAWAKACLDGGSDIVFNGDTLQPTRRGLTGDEQAEFDTVCAELAAFDEIDDPSPDLDAEYRSLNERLAAIRASQYVYEPAEKTVAGVIASLDYQGAVSLRRGIVLAADIKRLKAIKNHEPDASIKKPPPATKDYNAKLTVDLTAERSYAVALGLIGKPGVASDFALFALALSTDLRFPDWFSFHPAPADIPTSVGYTPRCAEAFGDMQDTLDTSWKKKSIFDSFLAFRALSKTTKDAWTAFAMQRHLKCPGTWSDGRTGDIDRMAALLSVDLRDTFTPDAAFLTRLTKPQLLAVAADLDGQTLKLSLSGLKKSELVSALALIFEGGEDAVVYGRKAIEAARAWTPSHMGFPKSKAAAKPTAKKSSTKGRAAKTKPPAPKQASKRPARRKATNGKAAVQAAA